MSSPSSDIEIIFNDVLTALEKVIDEYRRVFMDFPDEVMSDQTFAFCDEMEGLKRKIADKTQSYADRVENVSHIAEYINDLLTDESEERKEKGYQFIEKCDEYMQALATTFGIAYIPSSIKFEEINKDTTAEQPAHEKFFQQQTQLLRNMLRDHPELK